MGTLKCGCVIADSKNTESVRKGYDMGGYYKEFCDKHRPRPSNCSVRQRVTAFFNDIELVCIKHDMSIAHDDYAGNFRFEPYSEENLNWLSRGTIAIKEHEKMIDE